MSAYKYDTAGYSGQSYDRNVFEANLSTVNKLQRDFWTAKQVLRKKFGKQDDDCVVASDSEIDAKLDLFGSIQKTCIDLIKLIEQYQHCICALSRDENAMGRFLKDQGSLDKTPAGKLMGAMGKAQCFTSQQRLTMRNSLARLHHDVETFRYRAIADCLLSINNMEEARTHYRASLRWMQDISSNLDPEQYKKLEKFRKVQTEVRLNKEKFDRLKWAVCQKVDLLSASRTNLFSNTLVPYQTELGKFWEKSSHCLAAVLENIKDHKHYEFKLLKDLNPLSDSNEAYGKQQTAAAGGNQEQKKEETNNQDLVNLGDFGDFEDNKSSVDASQSGNTLLGSEEWKDKKDEDDDDLLLDDLLGNEASGEFEKQWESVFGEFKKAEDEDDDEGEMKEVGKSKTLSLENLLIDDGDAGEKEQQQTTDNSSSSYLPSQLLDLMTVGDNEDSSGQRDENDLMSMMGQTDLFSSNLSQPNTSAPNIQPSSFYNMKPPSYGSSVTSKQNQPLTGKPSHQHRTQQQSAKAAWYDLFAELDPLQNPDALGRKKEDNDKNKDGGGSC